MQYVIQTLKRKQTWNHCRIRQFCCYHVLLLQHSALFALHCIISFRFRSVLHNFVLNEIDFDYFTCTRTENSCTNNRGILLNKIMHLSSSSHRFCCIYNIYCVLFVVFVKFLRLCVNCFLHSF